jgi:UDP-2,3-diacylglucosamine pyrophosphatase LpxH
VSVSPILVISDTHLGFEDESAVRFQRFMTYLTNWVRRGRITINTSLELPDTVPQKELHGKSIIAPQKIILLGDMLDLWISRDSNTLRPYQESFNIFNSLIALNREIIWLLGNHDGIMKHYKGTHYLSGGAPFSVFCDGYPNGKGPDGQCKAESIGGQGERIGERTYFFIHGHQFDPIFSHQSMLRFGNFMGFSSATAGGFLWFKLLGAIVFLLTVGVVFSAFFWNWLPSLLSGSMEMLEPWPPLAGFMLFLLWLVGAIAFLGILWLFNVLARWYYNYSLHPGHIRKGKNSKDDVPRFRERIRQRIGTRRFDREAKHIDADVFVVGHTHVPDIYTPEHWPKKLVVNSGSWIVQGDEPHDTFVYIDEKGARLLQWNDEGGYVSELKSSVS